MGDDTYEPMDETADQPEDESAAECPNETVDGELTPEDVKPLQVDWTKCKVGTNVTVYPRPEIFTDGKVKEIDKEGVRVLVSYDTATKEEWLDPEDLEPMKQMSCSPESFEKNQDNWTSVLNWSPPEGEEVKTWQEQFDL